MYPSQFEYHRAEDVDHAIELLAEHPDAELLAGGHSLIPTMKSGLASPDVVIDIGGLDDLRGIQHGDEAARVGALTTYATVTGSEDLWEDVTVVAEAAGAVGDVQVRNMGTLGGNIAHSDPASDLPAAALAADATIRVRGPDGERAVDADDFFVGMYTTGLEADELLTSVALPTHGDGTASAYVKRPSPSSGYAMVGVAAVLDTDDGEIESARVACNGVMDHAVRLDPVEADLAGAPLEEAVLASAAERAAEDLDEFMVMEDAQASADFRTDLLEVFTERALAEAAERVGVRTVAP